MEDCITNVNKMGLPELPEIDTPISTNHDLVIPDDDTAEEEDNVYEGYERLPLQANDNEASDADDESEEASDDEAADNALPNIESFESALVQEVWSKPNPIDIEMDGDKVKQVKEAMLNFTLPESSIPDWASNIPEEEWKEHIFNRLKMK